MPRRPPTPPLLDLIICRKRKFPLLEQRDFAKMLGVSRLHMTAVERGRRAPSIEVVVRWLELLHPDGKIDMFGDIPAVAAMKKYQELTRKAA